jgi:AbrB family looped-hinge helix DNA binding protein
MTKAFDARVAQNGRLVLPKSVREALGLSHGGTVVFSVEGDEVRLSSLAKSIEHAQALYRRFARDDAPVDQFLAERRRETAQDEPT